MRENCLKMVYELAKQDERVVFIGSDLGVGVLSEFKKEIPARFFMEGVSEQNLVGVAAGMAMEGRVVYLNTIATFLSRRCYEQVAVDLCLHNVNVRLIANGGGVVYAPLGPTHLAIEDVAIMRALPNMTVVAPADAAEMVRFMKVSVDHPGPIYIRVAKGHDPVVTSDTGPFVIGKAVPMRAGDEVLITTTGVGLQVSLAAAEKLATAGVEAAVLHFPTVKPLDTDALHAHAERAAVIVSAEEHTVIGGLGSAVAEYLAETDLLNGRRFKRIGIPDVFPSIYGDQNGIMRKYGISADNIAAQAQTLLAGRPGKAVRVAA
ncbi:MAG: Transketolase, central region:Transketolase, terminal [Gemmataceae bacterium]|nr:Transketolase, central region:Transketolase, terminal [Gemmataceae bacterium]